MVEFDELLVTTGVDALVRLVKEKGRIELTDAAAALNIPESTIEEWGGVLEEEGILKIEYRLTKIFLTWVAPTEEETAAEKKEFDRKKASMLEEVGELRQKVQPDVESLKEFGDSFEAFYAKASPRLAELEKKLEGVRGLKATSASGLGDYLSKIDSASEKLDEIKAELAESKEEMDSVGKKIEKGPTKKTFERLGGLTTDLEAMKKELAVLRQKAEKYGREAPSRDELPKIEDMEDKLKQLSREFREAKERTAKLREDLTGLQEGKDVLRVIGESMKDYDKKIAGMRTEITALYSQANEAQERSAKLADKLEKDKDTLERFTDSMGVAKEILARFPSQKDIAPELERMQKSEKAIDERIKALKKLLEAVGGGSALAVEYEELANQMGERIDQLSSETEELEKALAEQKETFMAFQSIREKVTPSVERYRKEMETISADLAKAKTGLNDQTKDLEAEANKRAEQLKKDKVKEVMDLSDEVEKRRAALESVKSSLESLSSSSENLTRKLVVLSRQAGMLEIRAGGGIPAGEVPETSKEEVTKQIALTRDEEAEFKRKREELRGLIKKLWEEGKEGKK